MGCEVKEITGGIMLGTPIILFIVLMIRELGWRDTLISLGLFIGLFAWLFIGAYLLEACNV